MFWADRIAQQIIESGKYKPYWVDDMKTPSGRIHVGSLRGVVIHDLVYKALLTAGQEATFTYVFEDHDPMDGMPVYLDAGKWSKYLGQPLFTIPSPDGKARNYGEYFALEFQDIFNKIGTLPEILWSSELYTTGKMNKGIKLCLDQAHLIRAIYEELYKKKLPDNWFPFHVVCPKCQKESTTQVTDWDGQEVTFTCRINAVDWTKGCGYSGKISPFSGKGKFVGKLPWKVEWAVKWQVIGVTVEGAGKDHMTAGGSHDLARLVCERVLEYQVPYPIAYEFFLVGGKKMSSSKGLGTSAKEISEVIPPYLLRFLFTRTDYIQAINFNPLGNMYIPDLFDEYDRCWQAYIKGSDENLSRAFELSQIDKTPEKKEMFISRFIDVVNYIQQPNIDIQQKYRQILKRDLTFDEHKLLMERALYARIWIGKYAPSEYRMQMSEKTPKEVVDLTHEQKKYLAEVVNLVESDSPAGQLQLALYNLAKELKIDVKLAFTAIYTAFIGKTHGPRAAWFLLQYPKEQVIARLKEAASHTSSPSISFGINSSREVTFIVKQNLFTIDPIVKEQYPSISIGIALIKNVKIEKINPQLEKEKEQLLQSLKGMTTESLGRLPEIISYRKLYKEMGINWHSRRPSPEALLRRFILGKGLYSINTCVDAYNLVVMKHRISVGAFDADKIKFPTVLRYAGKGDTILLLGDSEPTEYTEKELAYYDQHGGYNIDFNFRDAQRTAVQKSTKNLLINIDGVFDITRNQMEKTLHEVIDIIIKYCGGKVEFEGIISAK